MAVHRFDPKRRPSRHSSSARAQRDLVTPLSAAAAVVAVGVLGWVAADQFLHGTDSAGAIVPSQMADEGRRVNFGMCGQDRYTCVVDGDTVWLDGVNLRLQSYDTPEPYDDICGGAAEVALAKRGSSRLLQLLNANAFVVQSSGKDRYDRTLATILIGGRDVGDILIEEGLARRWPDGEEFWC